MRRILSIVLFSCVSLVAQAQYGEEAEAIEYKPFRVDFTAGLALIPANIWSGGVVAGIEPRYAIAPRVNLGLRVQGAGLARIFYQANLSDPYVRANASAMVSVLATGDYYLATAELRPFVGLGAGTYSFTSASFEGNTGSNTNPAETQGGTKFGVMTRAGLDAFHLRFAVEYNFVGASGRTRNSYLGITAGFYLGGGKRKEPADW